MANAVYNVSKADSKKGDLDLDTETLYACLVSSAYVFSAAHATISALSGLIGTWVPLGTVSVDAAGVAQMAGSITLGAGEATAAVAVIIARGNAAGSKPLVYLDDPDGGAASFSQVPGAGGLSVSFPSGFWS